MRLPCYSSALVVGYFVFGVEFFEQRRSQRRHFEKGSIVKTGSYLTHRERVLMALNHQSPDRAPVSMICAGINPPALAHLDAYLRNERGITAASYLDNVVDLQAVAPRYIAPPLPAGTDFWGVRRRGVSYGVGKYDEIEYYPLGSARTLDDMHRLPWPSADWFDYESMRTRIDSLKALHHAIWASGWGNIFESAWYMRGFEQMLMDLTYEPELTLAILTHVTDFYVAFYHRFPLAGRGDIDIAFTADDLGSQFGLLMSIPMWEEHIKPHHARLNRAIHEHGAKIACHTDGAIMPVADGLRDMGIDILQALQFDAAGMDTGGLKTRHCSRLCFAGGVSMHHALPFGGVEDIRRETRMLIDILGRDGGYLCDPAHAIQAGTPPENIVAMFDEAIAIPR